MKLRNSIIKALSSFFYIGYLPFVSGTFASLAGASLFYLSRKSASLHILFTLSLIALGFLISGEAEKIFHKKDARCIVIDEVSGMLLAFLFIPYNIKLLILGFILFRLLDTLKPLPAGRLQNLSGSLGIMSDDIVAALYVNIILQILLRVTSFRAS